MTRVKKQRLLDGANWKESLDKRARARGLVKQPNPNSYLSGPKLFRIRQLAAQAGVTPERASDIVRRLRREGRLPPAATEHQGPVGLDLTEARIVLAALYESQGKIRQRTASPHRRS